MKHTIILRDPQQGYKALFEVLWPLTKSWLLCGGAALQVTCKTESRKDWQNRKFHWLIGHIAKQTGGDLASPDDAKRILISAFKIDTQNDPNLADDWRKFGDFRLGRGLRGEVVLLGTQSRDFSVKLASAFCIWLEAFCAEHSVALPALPDDAAPKAINSKIKEYA